MPSNGKDSIGNLVSIFTALNKIKDVPKGISSHPSVIKDGEGKVKPALDSAETARLINIADVLGKKWKIGDYAPKVEAARLEDLTPDKQKNLGISAIGDKVKSIQPAEKKDSLMDLLGGLLAMLGLGKISSLFSKVFNYIKSKLGSIFKAVGQKLLASMKWVADKLWKTMQWVGNKIWSAIKWLGNKLLSWGNKIVGKIKGSKFFTGFMERVGKVKDALKSVWDDVIKSIKGFIDDIIKNIVKVKDVALNALKRVPGYNLLSKGMGAVAKGATAVGGAVAKGTTAVGGAVAKGATAVGGAVAKKAGNLLGAAKSKIGSFVGKLFSGGASKVGGFFRNIPLIAPIIEGLFAANDIKNLKSEYTKGNINLDELRFNSGKRVIEAITGVSGAVLGGAALSFIPGIGTLVGAVSGDYIGRYLGDLLVNKMVSPDITKKLGEYITGKSNVTFGELQDFFIKDNKVFSFSNKDEVLGMKTGGAIDNLINSRPDNTVPESITAHNQFAKSALIEQIKRQDTMIELLMQLVRKPVGNSTVINKQQGGTSTAEDFRTSFNTQTLAY